MNNIKECFETILNSGKEESQHATLRVRKLIYGSREIDTPKTIAALINGALAEYGKIREEWRQKNFVMAISVMYFLHDREDQPDFLFPWFFHLLQHKNGNVRHAAVRMINHELGSLTYHIRFPNKPSDLHEFSPEQADRILAGLEINLNNLLESSWQEKYKRYKYICDLPSGTYKSVELILGYLEDLREKVYPSSEVESSGETQTIEEVLKRRKEIEQELVDMLKETGSDFTLDHVRDVIFHEEDNDDMMKVVMMFDRGGDVSELENVLELVTDAWNYFPHEVLGGVSPTEKLLECPNPHK